MVGSLEIENIKLKTYTYSSGNLFLKMYISENMEAIKTIVHKEVMFNNYLKSVAFEYIPKLLSVIKKGNCLCFERINSRNLGLYIKEKHDFKSRFYLYIKILRVFEILHKKNVLHSDISLENILVNYVNDVIIIDFSESVFVNQIKSLKKYVAINVDFSSEKKYMNIEVADSSIDTYSLIVLIKYMFKNEQEIFKDIIQKGLNKNFNKRYMNVSEILDDIRGKIEYI